MRRSCARSGGFTLLELLIALAIFAVLGVTTYGTLINILQQKARVDEQADRLHQLQLCYRLLQRDFEQFVPRGIRNEYGDREPPLQLGGDQDALEYTRSGWHNPAHQARSTLQRIAYAIDQDRLVRHSWQVLDRAQDSEPGEQVLLEQVTSLQLRLLGEGGNWHTEWPPLTGAEDGIVFPRAAEMVLELEDLGEVRWLFRLAG